jgi:hypothetical protein
MVHNGRAGRQATTPVWRHTQATRPWPPHPTDGRSTRYLIATKDLADARKRLSLIAIMAQTAMNRLDGNPGYLWPV